MRAIVQKSYGSPDVLRLSEIDRPRIGDNQVLVRVKAAALHVGDTFIMRGAPFLVRTSTGLFRPKLGITGLDLCGTVAETGAKVTRFKPGDEVFGSANGTAAEFAATTQDTLAIKPANLTYEEAAALPTSALAALHAMRDVARIKQGQTVLINGASGGVGTFAVQIAKTLGAEVTGVCSGRNVDLVRSLGADHTIDYSEHNFTESDQRYDVILDNVENYPLKKLRAVLSPTGTLILNSGTGATGLKLMIRLIKPLLLSPFIRQNLRRYLSLPNHEDLEELKILSETGKLRPVIGHRCNLDEVPEAMRLLEAGHNTGKTVVTI